MSTPVYLHTLGCPKNRVDSEVMLGTLVQAGYRLVQDPARADVIVVNTCGFIESAKQESVEAILELAALKAAGRCRKLVVAGCLTQRYHAELSRQIPEVDHFVGTGAYQDIARIVADAQAERIIVPDPDFVHSASTPRVSSLPSHAAYLKIAEGCDNDCAFCIIPALRGPQRSRPIDDLVAEAGQLAARGVVELSLVAQDLTAWGHDLPGRPRLHQLLPELAQVDGLRWLRLHYAYPRDFPEALVGVMAREPRIAKYLDMPLQHSSDRLLRSMRRGRDSRFLRQLLARIRAGVPGIAIRTTLIVGLPGETEADFQDLLRFVEEQRFERLGVFTYSREEGTAAARMPGQVPEKVKRARFERVMALQQGIARAHQRAMVGRRLEVLVEGRAEETEHLLAGRHAQQAPEIDGLTYLNEFAVPGEKDGGTAYPGELVTAEVTEAGDYDLVARVVGRDATRAARRLPRAPERRGRGRPALPVIP
ncbi:MAG TPA: 30S ribosomal protein S12 methylthiotransferase RimO [Anaeromyxobacteraceae bacterium]|nr:30S ribosomal protein S12 methylthiotransferase RimO [Anaeromyxobacteraceae bacterium]